MRHSGWRLVNEPIVGSHVFLLYRPFSQEAVGEVLQWGPDVVLVRDPPGSSLGVTKIDLDDVVKVWEWF